MNCALHGNVGLPDDLMPLLRATGQPFENWHLWRTLANHPEVASLNGFATLLNDTASRDGEYPRILLGYSLGGRLALTALTQKPRLWDAAILLSAHPGLRSDAERGDRLARDKAWAARFRSEPWPEVIAAWNDQEVFRSSNSLGRDGGDLEPWREQIARGFDVWSLERQDDLRPLLPPVLCPVLWVTGARDEKFTALAAEACALLPRARHVIIPTAGHRVHLDQATAVEEEVAGFLREAGLADGAETGKPVAAPGASS